MIWRLLKDFKFDIVFSACSDYDIDSYYIYIKKFLMHKYVESSLPMFPHVHNIASQTMDKVHFETFQSLQLMNIVI